jgi:predicted PurR-regulated permease PerM
MLALRQRLPRRSDDQAMSQFEIVLETGAHLALVFLGCILLLVVLVVAQAVLAPVCLALVIGLMFGPIADWCEARGVRPELSAAVVVLLLLLVIAAAVLLFAVPLSLWAGRAPEIWAKLQARLSSLREPLQSITALQTQIATIFGGPSAIAVRVADGNGAISLAMIAPAVGAQVLLCLACLYFFVATRHSIRVSVLSLCVSRRVRWRMAHVFGDIEEKVSRFLLSVTVLNLGVGVVVSLAMWAVGMPSPILWGALAMALNYVPYIGQAVMVLVLGTVAFGTQTEWASILLPVGCYLVITFIEGQFVTPHVLGRTMTLNPFLILLSATFWLWAWGPVGGFISMPALLILQSALSHVLQSNELVPRKRVRRTAKMTENDLVLANAAQAIKEKAEAEAAAEEAKAAEAKAKEEAKAQEAAAKAAAEAEAKGAASTEKDEAPARKVRRRRTPARGSLQQSPT